MDSERAIEKALRAIAGQRRKAWGGGIQLHPANRRLLQGEARERYGLRPSRERRLWPRLAWGFGVAAAVVVFVLVIDRPGRMEMAQSKPSELNGDFRQPSSVDRARRIEGGELKPASPVSSPASRALAETAPPPSLPEQPAVESATGLLDAVSEPTSVATRRVTDEDKFRANEPAAPTPASAPVAMNKPAPTAAGTAGAAPPATVSESLLAKSASAQDPSAGLRYAAATGSVEPALRAAPVPDAVNLFSATGSIFTNAPVAVLSTFSVEQQGELLRITDADGSVYTGPLVAADASTTRDHVLTRQSTAARVFGGGTPPTRSPAGGSASPRVYSFHVQGTNRSLLQPVSFTGTFHPGVEPGAAQVFTDVYGVAAKAKKESASTNVSREISGRVRLGTGPERTVKGVPAYEQ